MRSIVSRGRTINEAINMGLSILGTTLDNVDIEILQYETNGILGFGKKKAIVKLLILNPSFSLPKEELVENGETENEVKNSEKFQSGVEIPIGEQQNTSTSGTAWVKDGIIFSNSSEYHYPVVTLHKGVELYRNGSLIEEKTVILNSTDMYELKAVDEYKESTWNISVKKDKLEAVLEYEPGYKIVRTIPDSPPSRHIDIVANDKIEMHNTINLEKILEKIAEMGITTGVDLNSIQKALNLNKSGVYVIASGAKPIAGENGWVEPYFALNAGAKLVEKEDGSIDFREMSNFPIVERGRVLGIIHPPINGKDGYSVLGLPIPAPKVYPVAVNTGAGVSIIDNKIVALESGRPFMEKKGLMVKISIFPKLVHQGNVNLESGNIRFTGDVEIHGEIEKNMTVEAQGNITISKSVNGSSVTAFGSIVSAGSIINSELSSGKQNLIVTEMGKTLSDIYRQIESIVEVTKQLASSPAFKSSNFSKGGLQPLIKILLERKFKDFPELIMKYSEQVDKSENFIDTERWKGISRDLQEIFIRISAKNIQLESILYLAKTIKELYEWSASTVEPNSYIVIPNSLNSTIYSSGNIKIFGSGSINSKIYAGGSLEIEGTVRGGILYAGLGVTAKEAGTENGVTTTIEVPRDKHININKVYEGTIIKIGSKKYTFTEIDYYVHIYLDKNEHIVVKKHGGSYA